MVELPLIEAKLKRTIPTDTDVIAVFHEGGKNEGGKKPITPKAPQALSYVQMVKRFQKKTSAFNARQGSIEYIRFGGLNGAENCLLVGLGQAAELNEEKLRVAGASAWAKLKSEKSSTVTVYADTLYKASGLATEHEPASLVAAFAEGMLLSAYQFDKYKSGAGNAGSGNGNAQNASDNASGPAKVYFLTSERNLFDKLTRKLGDIKYVAEAVKLTRDWSNEPSNVGTPEYYAGQATRLSREFGLKCEVLKENDARKEKMGLFLGVGQGAEREGRVVVVEYAPKRAKNPKTVVLVGKGITFDSGGISIKPAQKMEEMKHDMTGAATVMGAILLASKLKVTNRVIAVMGFTENMPSGNAIQPGNILTSRSGKTVEVINTDAEGRLILADMLDYACDFKPDAIIDVATLTGAVSIALGKLCCAVLGNDDALVDSIRAAGAASGERIWQLPLYDEYFEDLKSDCADMKNSANDSYGGTIRGAIFLKQFIKKGVAWAHLDIAAMAANIGHFPYFPKKGASGAYVRTLASLAAEF